MEQNKIDLTEMFRKLLIKVDILFHIIAAIFLLIACGVILYYAFLNILEPTHISMIALVNDVLLALIILELLWTVMRFLKKRKILNRTFYCNWHNSCSKKNPLNRGADISYEACPF